MPKPVKIDLHLLIGRPRRPKVDVGPAFQLYVNKCFISKNEKQEDVVFGAFTYRV